jgi:hypothetical protein
MDARSPPGTGAVPRADRSSPHGPFTIRRPIVRAASACVLALIAALVAWFFKAPSLVPPFLALAVLAFLPIWAKWRFNLLRLPVVLLVPVTLVAALLRGRMRVTEASRRSRRGTPART